jgi:peptidoglycan hydrolase-like protein with peptidoglycan-binding domain
MGNRGNRIALFAVSIGLGLVASVCANDNVRAVQEKLRDDGFYVGKIDGGYGTELAAALSRYQIVNGLPITGQLDAETAKALGAKPAVPSSSANDQARTSETWQGLRKGDWEFLARLNARRATPAPAAGVNETPNETMTGRDNKAATTPPGTQSDESSPQESPPSGAAIASDGGKPASPPPATAASSPAPDFSTERLRDYVGAFVLAGLDPQVGAEAAFFADRVQYYNEGMKDREKIWEDLKRYDSRWPGRKFWLAGDITVEPQTDKRVRVTFPLRYELRNGGKRSSGKVDKTLVLERAGDDLQIVAVNERKAE